MKGFYLGSLLFDLICLSLLCWGVRVGMIQWFVWYLPSPWNKIHLFRGAGTFGKFCWSTEAEKIHFCLISRMLADIYWWLKNFLLPLSDLKYLHNWSFKICSKSSANYDSISKFVFNLTCNVRYHCTDSCSASKQEDKLWLLIFHWHCLNVIISSSLVLLFVILNDIWKIIQLSISHPARSHVN